MSTSSTCALVESKSRVTGEMAISAKAVLVMAGVVCALVAPQVDANTQHCLTESGATRKMLVDFLQGENDSREVKCFLKCQMMEHGKMDADGNYNMESMKKVMTPSLYQIASTTCADFQGSDLCEKAYSHIACLRDHAKDEMIKNFPLQ